MITAHTDGTVTFRVYLPHAGKVEVLGDFTDWRERKAQMTRENQGWWSVTLNVEPGDYLFCYLVDGCIWLADYAAHGVKMNQYGGWVSRLLVEESTTTVTRGQYAAA